MNSDSDDVIDHDLIDYEEEGDEVFDDQEFDDEEGDLEEGEFEDEDMPLPKKVSNKKNGKMSNKRPLEEEQDDEEFDEGIMNGKNDEDEIAILEKIRESRITSQKFFEALSGKGKNRGTLYEGEEDLEEDDGDETYITQTNLDQLEEAIDNEKLKEVQKGREDFIELISELKDSVKEIKEKFTPVLTRLKNEKFQMKDGLNYVDAKFHLINQYCTNLAFYALMKIQGKSIKDHPALRQLIYIKTMVNKLKPLDKKLEYQITKMLRLANEETLIGESYAKSTDKDIADPLALKPRPDTMSKTLTTEEIDVDEHGTVVASQKKREGKYIAPKLVSTLMEEEAKTNRKIREEDRMKKKQLKNEFFRTLQEDYEDTPVEIRDNFTFTEVEDEKEKARRRYEEDNFVRLPTTKEDKRKQKEKLKRINQGEDVGDLTQIREVGKYFEREQERKNKALDAKDDLMRKTLASTLTKRRNDRVQNGDNEDDFFEGGLGNDDDGDRKFFSGRKQVKQEKGGFQSRRPDRGGFGGQKSRGGFGGSRGQSRGFSRGRGGRGGRGGRKPF